MKLNKLPFGTYQPSKINQSLINFCRGLSNNWFSKQITQLIRKFVLIKTNLPLDLKLDGLCMRCYLTDNISERNFVFMPWRYDVLERQIMLNCLPSDGVFIDIGANVGIYSTLAIQHLSQNGQIIAIEPNPPVNQRLIFNIQATQATQSESPRIRILQLGLSDTKGEFDLYLDGNNLGASSIISSVAKTKSIKIPCNTLLNVIESNKLSKVDVIKCDIEGAEDQALIPFLKNASKELLPHCIIFENNQQQWYGDLLKVLAESNYSQLAQTRLNYIYILNGTSLNNASK